MAKVKKALGGRVCISGNLPASLPQMSDVEGVINHCSGLIDIVGKDSGFIMGTNLVVDEVRPE